MAITMPQIDITFKQQASSLIARSERGIAILIVKDDTNAEFTHKQYTDLTALDKDKALYTAENYNAIYDMLLFAPYEAHVFRFGSEGSLSDTLAEITRSVKTGWITMAGQTPTDADGLVSWIKTQEAKAKSYKAVVYKPSTAPDNMHIVNFVNEKVTFNDEKRGEQDGLTYLPSLISIFAVCNITRGCTNYHCSNLSFVEEAADNDEAVGAGKFVLYNDEDNYVRIGQGINSLTTTDGLTKTDDMKFIETVEAMDMIRDDITKTFRSDYLGNYRNSRDNQMLFIAAINNSYFYQLAKENVLDANYNNAAAIDITAQRQAWLASGKSEAASWDDDTVKAMTYKRDIYLAGDVKILGSMTNLYFPITMA